MIKIWLDKIRKWLAPEKGEINTVYFTFFLVFVIGMSLSHFFFWKTPLSGVPLFFFLHALGQCFLEAGVLLLSGFLLKRVLPKWLFHAFIGFSFAILLAHFANFTIIRLMDSTISHMFKHFFGSGITHLTTAFLALNMNTSMIALIFSSLVLIPFLGIAFYRATEPLSKKIPWRPSLPRLILTLLAISGALFALDLLFHPFLNRLAYAKYQKILPMGKTFMPPGGTSIGLPKPVAHARDEPKTRSLLIEKNLLAASKPNIYLFVIETLRKDFITKSIAPNLCQFGCENLSFKDSFSNANSTHPSWFAIFHADYPYHWTHMRDHWSHGSIPLQILKDFGYKIRVYSSADLRYFNMDELIFGKDRKLADQIEEYSQNRLIEPCERDKRALNALLHDLESEEARQGNLFILFFDSTHSEYSIPSDFPLRFRPSAKEIDYLTLTAQNLEPVKNRYRNSIAYIDSLCGLFFESLKTKGLYNESIIALTGDHGEEFFEEGAIFHGSHLNSYQTSVPLFYKFQNNPWIPLDSCSTHLDIFPSIIHYLTGRSDLENLFDGQSIFAPNRWTHRLCVLQNGPHTPCEFSLEKNGEKFRFRFPDPNRIYETSSLEILSSEYPLPFDGSFLTPLLQQN